MSKRANFPTTNDIQNQIESSFESAGCDKEPILIESQQQATNEVEKLVKDFNVPRAEWDFTIKAIERTMGLINGGLFDYLNDQMIKNNFSKIYIPLLAASNNLRSALVKQSCLLIAQIAHILGPLNKFDLFVPIGDDVIASLSSQTSHGTQIIAESCRFAIIHIARSCANKKILRSIIELSKFKSSANRLISADCLCFVCGCEINENTINPWNETKLVEQNDNIIIEALQRLMEDASQNIRKTARMASQIFIEKYPDFKEQFLSGTDERSIEYIDRKIEMKKKGISKKRSKSPYVSALPVSKNKRKKSSLPTSNANGDDNQTLAQKTVNINDEKKTYDYQRQTKKNNSNPKARIDSQTTNENDNSSFNRSAKHRSRSSLPSRPTNFESKPSLKYDEENENEFLTKIEVYININQQFELSTLLNSIIPGLIQCIQSEDKSISKRSILITQNLMNTYSNNFAQYIPQILHVILSPNNPFDSNDQKFTKNTEYTNEDESMTICRDMQAIYDPNLLLESTEGIVLSPLLLKFIANLCDDIEIDLHKNEVCDNVYSIAMQFINEDHENARRIIYAIWCQNVDFFIQKSKENLHNENDEQDSQSLEGLNQKIQKMIQDFKENPDYPRFNPRGVSLWCNEVRKFIQTEKYINEIENNNDSEDVKSLYKEISHALILTNEKNLVILLMTEVLAQSNNSYFDIFLFEAVKFYRDKKAKDILKLLKYMIANIDNGIIIKYLSDDANQALQLRNKTQQITMIRNIIEILTEIIKNGDKTKVDESFDQIEKLLFEFIDNKDTEVRRVVIMAFVELSIAVEKGENQETKNKMEKIQQEKMTKVQQKLVNFYRDQKE